MPGYLSSLFGEGDHQEMQDQHLVAHLDPSIDETVSVHTNVGGSYQGLDGSTNQWSSEHDLDAHVSTQATIAAAADMIEDGSGSAS
jgi:hypothetical protein